MDGHVWCMIVWWCVMLVAGVRAGRAVGCFMDGRGIHGGVQPDVMFVERGSEMIS